MRDLPLTPQDRTEVLARVGVADIDALFADVPADKLLKKTTRSFAGADGSNK